MLHHQFRFTFPLSLQGFCSNSFKRRGLSSQRIISILLWLKKKDARKVWSRHCSLEVYSTASNPGAVNNNDHLMIHLGYHLCMYWISNSNLEVIFERSSRSFCGQTVSSNTSLWRNPTLSFLDPVLSHPEKFTTHVSTSEPEVTRRLGILDSWVKNWVIPSKLNMGKK